MPFCSAACSALCLISSSLTSFAASSSRQQRKGRLDRQLASFRLAPRQVREHALQLAGHFLHARGGADLDAGLLVHLELDLPLVQFAFPQLLAQQLTGARALALATVARRRQEGVEDALFGGLLGTKANALHRLLAQHLDGHLHEIADDRLDVAPDVADLRELGRLHLDERRVRQARQAAGDFRLADARGPDHQDVLGGDFRAQRLLDLHAPPAVAQRVGDGAFCLLLADDVLVQLVDDFSGSHVRHGVPGQ
jgi:hypothetical protein